ncbi:YqhG family protein, partial [Priestia megaterium]
MHQFLNRYFLPNNCSILTQTPSYLNLQLTIQLDKQFINPPFYSHYLQN